jgi:predicted dehydrogenase
MVSPVWLKLSSLALRIPAHRRLDVDRYAVLKILVLQPVANRILKDLPVPDIGIGVIGGGYMGKAHAVAMAAVGAVFDTGLRPRLAVVCASSEVSAERYRAAYGFARGTADWRDLVDDPAVGAVVIASPQATHRAIAEAALALGKPVLCEKPMGATLADAQAMVAAAEATGCTNMIGFNYIRTPASQYARQLIAEGAIGDVTWFRGEHTEDFYADPDAPPSWRTSGRANGTMGDLAPHMINAARALIGPITDVMAEIETVHATRGGVAVTNDDQAQMFCRFEGGAMGHLFFSRIATGRKMGYAYEVHGTAGAIRFDQEDQNALWLYQATGPEAQRGFRKILTGPAHPDYLPFCQGPGHGTGYQDQIIIEARDFLRAIETGQPVWPTFEEGLAVHRVIAAGWESNDRRAWVSVNDV